MGRWRLAGIVVLLLALGLVLVAVFVPLPAGSRTVPAGEAWTITSASWAVVSVTVTWSASAEATEVFVVSGAPSCSNPTNVVASGSGSQGSLSTEFRSGATYDLFACSGTNWETAHFSLSATGTPDIAEPLEVIGAILGFFGAVLVLRKEEVPPSRPRYARHRP
jgi:hypothetical protein